MIVDRGKTRLFPLFFKELKGMSKALRFDAKAKTFSEVEIKELSDIYSSIGCELFENHAIRINDNRYNILIDEEGRFKNNPVISGYSPLIGTIVGNVIIAGPIVDGEYTDITSNDVINILSSLTTMQLRDGKELELLYFV